MSFQVSLNQNWGRGSIYKNTYFIFGGQGPADHRSKECLFSGGGWMCACPTQRPLIQLARQVGLPSHSSLLRRLFELVGDFSELGLVLLNRLSFLAIPLLSPCP